MRALFGNNCAKGCLIYVIAVVAIVIVAAMGLGGLRAKFGGAAVEGTQPQYTIQSTGQSTSPTTIIPAPTVPQPQIDPGNALGQGIAPTATSVPIVVVIPPVNNSTPVPAQSQGGTITGDGGDSFYIVQSGDTLWGISKNFGVDLDALTSLNGLNDSIIYAGQALYLPTTSQQQVTVPTPTEVIVDNGGDTGTSPIPSMPDTGINTHH